MTLIELSANIAFVMANIRAIVFGMPDNYIQARIPIFTMPYIKKRIRRYVGGILEKECIELYRRFSEEETILCLKGGKQV